MPIHDWTRADAGTFHYFHQAWTIELSYALNGGALPPGYFAMAEQIVGGPIPDVITLKKLGGDRSNSGAAGAGVLAVADAPPQARFVTSAQGDVYAGKADRIVIRHRLGQVVAVIEIMSPGNKSAQNALRTFIEKAAEVLRQGIHLLVVDLFPPSPRDPQGIHKEIWDEVLDEPFELPADKPFTVAAYNATPPMTAYVEPVAVGDALPAAPIFLDRNSYVRAPLEASYQATWSKLPDVVRELVEPAARD